MFTHLKLLKLLYLPYRLSNYRTEKVFNMGTRFDVPSPSRKTKANMKTMLRDLPSYAFLSIYTEFN